MSSTHQPKHRVAVIMAGGAGERFWPASHGGRPKQLLRLASEQSMLADAIARIEPCIPASDIFLVVGADIATAVREAVPQVPPANIIVEPVRRNTTACLALATAVISHRVGPHTMAVLTADHIIRPDDIFRQQVADALTVAEKTACLTMMGMRPTHPETGYGYMLQGDADTTTGIPGVHRVTEFREKPDLATAREYVASGHFFWNSGMFFWQSDVFEDALRRHVPEIGRHLETLAAHYEAGSPDFAPLFGSLPKLPVDVAIMEKADNRRVLRIDFDWDDIGSWTALERLHSPDEEGNIVVGRATLEDAHGCIIFSESGDGPAPQVAVLGMSDVIVAVSGHRILVLPKSRAQEVKTVVARLKE